MKAKALSIAVLARNRLQQSLFRSIIEQSGNTPVASFLLEDVFDNKELQQQISAMSVDAWLFVTDADSNPEPDWPAEEWLASLQGITMYCDGAVPQTHEPAYQSWARRLNAKLHELTGKLNLESNHHGCAREVWLLAASTGGPTAVKEFLGRLPPALGVGFIYAQHIDAGYADTLLKVFSQGSHYPAYSIEHGCVVQANAVGIVPSQRATELLSNGTFLVKNQDWSGPYRPSIDSITASLADSYGSRSGVIVFTGMGDDGAISCRLMRKNGGRVWVQSPETCTVDAMPAAALLTECVDFEGSPLALARQLAQLYCRPTEASAPAQTLAAKPMGVCYD